MPEPYRPKRGSAFTLTSAEFVGQVIRISCSACFVKRYYLPSDLRVVFGDIEVDAIRGRMRCEKCERKDCIDVKGDVMSAEARQHIQLRRLAKIEFVPKVTWRDGPG